MNLKTCSLIATTALTLSACTLTSPQSPTLHIEVPTGWIAANGNLEEYKDGNWIASFNDTKLVELVAEALENNRNLKTTAANLEKAAAQAKKSGADLLPEVNLRSGAERAGNFQTSDGAASTYSASLDVSWEADVWGRIRAGADAAEYDYYAAEYDYEAAKQSLAAQTAKAYFMAIETSRQLELANTFEKNLEETLDVTEAFYEQGFLSLQDTHLVKADLARAKESVQNAISNNLIAMRNLEVLLGRYPAADLQTQSAFPAMPEAVPPGIPSDVLERRPDIRAAERRVAAAFNRIKVAHAAKLPSISLTGSLGAGSNHLNTLTDPANLLWNVAGSLLFPIFNAGELDADIDIRTAEQKSAIADYQQTALNTFSEIETALSNERLFRTRQTNLDEAYRNAEAAEKISNDNFKAGEIEMLDLLQIKRSTITTQIDQVRAQRELLEQRVNLHLALGGQI